jgi:hypothetical protein
VLDRHYWGGAHGSEANGLLLGRGGPADGRVLMRYEYFSGAVLATSLLILALAGARALLHCYPALGRARVVIPCTGGAAALLGVVDEVLFRGGWPAVPRTAFLASLVGVVWGVVFSLVIAGAKRMRVVRGE